MKQDPKRRRSVWEILLYLLVLALFIFYMRYVLHLTLLDRTPTYRRSQLNLFWELRELRAGGHRRYWIKQIAGNLLMLYPFGIFLPWLLSWMRKGTRVVTAAFLCSCTIELTQYYSRRGLLELDDVIHNTLGAWIGYLTFCLLYCIWKKLTHAQQKP